MTYSINNFGFDVSYYQAAINFQTMKDYGAKFVILRCGYAARKDLRFDEYMQTAPLYLPVRVYHYYDPTISPTEQANSVIATLSQYNLRGTRVWMDFEFTWAGAYSAPSHWKIYRDMLRQAGYKTGVYTRATWWDSRVGTYAAEFATDPVWAAQYNTSLNLVPKGWSKAMIWQQGTPSVGIAAGVSSKEIDYNLWNTEYNFADEWGVVQTPPPPIGAGMKSGTLTAGTTSLKIRSTPVALADNSNQIGGVYQGDTVFGDIDTASGWLHVSSVKRANGTSQIIDGFCSANPIYITLVDVTPAPTHRHLVEVFIDGKLEFTKALE